MILNLSGSLDQALLAVLLMKSELHLPPGQQTGFSPVSKIKRRIHLSHLRLILSSVLPVSLLIVNSLFSLVSHFIIRRRPLVPLLLMLGMVYPLGFSLNPLMEISPVPPPRLESLNLTCVPFMRMERVLWKTIISMLWQVLPRFPFLCPSLEVHQAFRYPSRLFLRGETIQWFGYLLIQLIMVRIYTVGNTGLTWDLKVWELSPL